MLRIPLRLNFVILSVLVNISFVGAAAFRPSNIKIPLHAPDVSKVKFSNAFPNLKFQKPIFMTNVPGDNSRFFVVEQAGLIRVFPNLPTVTTTQTFADLKNIVAFDGGEMGLLGMAFSPDYKQSGEFFISYTLKNPNRFVIARLKVSTNPNLADLTTRAVVLEVAKPANFPNHNGGMIAFGPDRKLYVGIGDSGSAGDPFKNGQNKNTLWGKILRIAPLAAKPYSIPVDNPLVGISNVKEELWAWGLRNPWRFSFDKKNGTLWLGDVGQDLREEINIIERGGNYGWNIYEAHLPFNNPDNIAFSKFKAPIWEYPHNPELSITGGYVYRGAKVPNLKERYLYADYGSGRVWALNYKNKQVISNDELGTVGQPSSFAQDEDGEVYVLSLSEGIVYGISAIDNPSTEVIPEKLSDTGIFSNTATMAVVDGVEEYPVIAPLWSDGALKKRWMGLPSVGTIKFSPKTSWNFPTGTFFVKHFEILLANGQLKRLETRIFFNHLEGWRGYTYKWNENQSDARLINDAIDEDLEVADVSMADGVLLQKWHYPSRAECLSCHNFSAGNVLGVVTGQLNTEQQGENFLDRMNNLQIFSRNIGSSSQYQKYLNPILAATDTNEIMRVKARSYLAANCSQCHNPTGPGLGSMDFRFHATDGEMNIVKIKATEGTDILGDLYRVDPGNPHESTLYKRIESLNNAIRMPPLATTIVDVRGLEIIEAWIKSL